MHTKNTRLTKWQAVFCVYRINDRTNVRIVTENDIHSEPNNKKHARQEGNKTQQKKKTERKRNKKKHTHDKFETKKPP